MLFVVIVQVNQQTNGMSRLFQKSISVDHCVPVSGPEEEEVKKRKDNKGLISKKLDKKDKKDKKEKETRYAHLGDDSTGEDELEGK